MKSHVLMIGLLIIVIGLSFTLPYPFDMIQAISGSFSIGFRVCMVLVDLTDGTQFESLKTGAPDGVVARAPD